ncbi:MAG: DUF4062 domain-containing protein [Acidobacteria bacterium]|nr:DUF4062 domain-containing protein [Acidobacteriota bacterium]
MPDTPPPRAPAERRSIRLFVSSTFRDLRAERDELVKRTHNCSLVAGPSSHSIRSGLTSLRLTPIIRCRCVLFAPAIGVCRQRA